MKHVFLITCLLLCFPVITNAQESTTDTSATAPLFSPEKLELLRHVDMNLNMRMGFRAYSLRGGTHDYQGAQFVNGYTALQISGKLYEKIRFTFRNRFNKATAIQTLDGLGSNIELAYIDIKASPKLHIQLGKMNAYFGGYQYYYNAVNILLYNDINANILSYVTGAGLTYQAFENHNFGFQILNSRTMHFQDKYANAGPEIKEPDWPVEVVLNWVGDFFGGKFQTNYSLSYSKEVKHQGTYFFTLGHRYKSNKLTVMYDFDYSYEQIDTKGIATEIINTGKIAKDVTYTGNWLRAEYKFAPKFTGLLTLMTSSVGLDTGRQHHLRTSYGAIPALYYHPFKNHKIRFFLAYIGRFFDYSNYAIDNYDASSYNKNAVRFGIIAPLWIL